MNAELGGAAIEGRYLFNSMHDAPNSSGLGTDAASAGAATVGEFLCDALHDTSNSLGVNADAFLSGDFWLHDFEGLTVKLPVSWGTLAVLSALIL